MQNAQVGNTSKRSLVSFLLTLLVGGIILRYAIFEEKGVTSILLLFLSMSIILIGIVYYFFPRVGKMSEKYECSRCHALTDNLIHGMCENCYRTYYANGNRYVKKV